MRNGGRRRSPAGGTAVGLVGGLVALILLGLQLPADPATGVTFSFSPFTDEGWSVLGARNVVLLGRWATDDWQLFWVQLPFNLIVAGAFELLGVGILQARVVSLACSVAAIALLGTLVARRLGHAAGIVAGIGMATCGLFLYYGRLALLEPMVVLFLVVGLALLLMRRADRAVATGVAAGSAFALAMGTKPTSAIVIAGILAGAALAGRSSVPGIGKRASVAIATIAVAGLAWGLVVLTQPSTFEIILRVWPEQSLPDSLGGAVARAAGYLRDSDGAIVLAAPLMVGSLAGVVLLTLGWRNLSGEQRTLAGAAVGWLVLGFAVILVVDYRPNRYVVPLVPPMAILTAFAFAIATGAIGRLVPAARARAVVAAVTVVAGIALAGRGVGSVVEWTAGATYRLPTIQAELASLITDGHGIQGAGPTMAMRVPSLTVVVQEDVNNGDLYETHNVRWLLINRQMVPTWAAIHPDVWEARQLLVCYPWPSGEACLFRVP